MLAVQALKPGALDHEKAWCILVRAFRALFICLLGSPLEWDFTQCISEHGACRFDADVFQCSASNFEHHFFDIYSLIDMWKDRWNRSLRMKAE